MSAEAANNKAKEMEPKSKGAEKMDLQEEFEKVFHENAGDVVEKLPVDGIMEEKHKGHRDSEREWDEFEGELVEEYNGTQARGAHDGTGGSDTKWGGDGRGATEGPDHGH